MCKIFTPGWRIVGEFITLGTLYNDMGIDCMEINGASRADYLHQTVDQSRGQGDCEDHTSGVSLFYLLYPEISSNVREENVNILLAKMLTSI